IPALEVEWCGRPDPIGPRDISFGPLSGGPLVAMLCFVAHRLGAFRNSAREVGASRLFCFNPGFSGAPNGVSFRRANSAQLLCIRQLTRVVSVTGVLPSVTPLR